MSPEEKIMERLEVIQEILGSISITIKLLSVAIVAYIISDITGFNGILF